MTSHHSRRSFFGAIAGVLASATIDPERLLWVPGKRLISIAQPLDLQAYALGPHNLVDGSFRVDKVIMRPMPSDYPDWSREASAGALWPEFYLSRVTDGVQRTWGPQPPDHYRPAVGELIDIKHIYQLRSGRIRR